MKQEERKKRLIHLDNLYALNRLEEKIIDDRVRAMKERCIENYGYVANPQLPL